MSVDPPATEQPQITKDGADTDDATSLNDLISSANLQYSLKNYDAAAEIYSQATELQASISGEMDPKNAELLYLYGRCLYKVAVAKSDVLGGQVAAKPAPKQEPKAKADAPKKDEGANKPFFQLLDDDDEEDEEDGEDGEGEAEEEEDDFQTAYEILDLARVLYEKQEESLEESTADKGKGKAVDGPIQDLSPELKHIKERLADTYDLQSEISLENERFEDAVEDSRSTMIRRLQLDKKESNLVAESHYKLALALEFTYFKAVREAKEAGSTQEPDAKMLYESVENLAQAVLSCDARIAIEEAKVGDLSAEEAAKKRRDVKEVKEIVNDMLIRVSWGKTTRRRPDNIH
jgi:HAT1-interacting factor 1